MRRLLPASTPSRHAYGPHPSQVAELWLPDGPAPDAGWPVAVVLHGGFWRSRYDLTLMDGLCDDLARRGHAAWNVEYRRLDGGGGVPETLDDAAAATDRLRTLNAPVDLARVTAVGHSAGGHLALWLAGRREPRVPLIGAVGQGAVADLVLAAALGLGDGVVARFCAGTPDVAPDAYVRASPAARVGGGVPQLLVHGAGDDIVPAVIAERYAAAARAAADPVALELRPGEGHFEHLDPAGGAWATAVGWLTAR